ncbi:hypothetical protein JCM19301_3572 [Jejuia pallidilutea]|uniref:Uncharacterized protein n=1 Tax=Jejuia pallidilutea TaxID=504487 RepID=A0A090W7W0_9FLAO|nr:hypothetical protein JCM19301_3572 [Jejuia pallidilutea]GAL71524.1 hypothetical protein JCM19302_1693 [Jejuia pallidilutea]GAL88478.1 hypothetical protein JCM19538_2991 [Jejuia pallidilutea]
MNYLAICTKQKSIENLCSLFKILKNILFREGLSASLILDG